MLDSIRIFIIEQQKISLLSIQVALFKSHINDISIPVQVRDVSNNSYGEMNFMGVFIRAVLVFLSEDWSILFALVDA